MQKRAATPKVDTGTNRMPLKDIFRPVYGKALETEADKGSAYNKQHGMAINQPANILENRAVNVSIKGYGGGYRASTDSINIPSGSPVQIKNTPYYADAVKHSGPEHADAALRSSGIDPQNHVVDPEELLRHEGTHAATLSQKDIEEEKYHERREALTREVPAILSKNEINRMRSKYVTPMFNVDRKAYIERRFALEHMLRFNFANDSVKKKAQLMLSSGKIPSSKYLAALSRLAYMDPENRSHTNNMIRQVASSEEYSTKLRANWDDLYRVSEKNTYPEYSSMETLPPLSALQQHMFKTTGKRIETPGGYSDFIKDYSGLTEEQLEEKMKTNNIPPEVMRLLRYRQYMNEEKRREYDKFNSIHVPGLVRNQAPSHVNTQKISKLVTDKDASVKYDKSKEYIAVDLDGTLAQQGEWKGADQIGAPVMRMLARVKSWLADGKNVKIFTARVADDPDGVAEKAIKAWCKKHLGQVLPVTNEKDMHCTRIWDNIAVSVKKNDGTQKLRRTPSKGINVDVKVGDTVMVGRFKNKKVKVEEIGTDENGLPTVNGRKLLTMRVEKLMKESSMFDKHMSLDSKKRLLSSIVGGLTGTVVGNALAGGKGALLGGVGGAGLGYGGRRLYEHIRNTPSTQAGRLVQREKQLLTRAAGNKWSDIPEDKPGTITSNGTLFRKSKNRKGNWEYEQDPAHTRIIDEAQQEIHKGTGSATPREVIREQYPSMSAFDDRLRKAREYRKRTGTEYVTDISDKVMDIPVPYVHDTLASGAGRYNAPAYQVGKVTYDKGQGNIMVAAHEYRHALQRIQEGTPLRRGAEFNVERNAMREGPTGNSKAIQDTEERLLDSIGRYNKSGDVWDTNYSIVNAPEREERLGALQALAAHEGVSVDTPKEAYKFLDDYARGTYAKGYAERLLVGNDFHRLKQLRKRMLEAGDEEGWKRLLRDLSEYMSGLVSVPKQQIDMVRPGKQAGEKLMKAAKLATLNKTAGYAYDPPMNADAIITKRLAHLLSDPPHKWRAETGTELVHEEPTRKELERIIANWELMTDEQKALSDAKSVELFGMSNREHAEKLMKAAKLGETEDEKAKEEYDKKSENMLQRLSRSLPGPGSGAAVGGLAGAGGGLLTRWLVSKLTGGDASALSYLLSGGAGGAVGAAAGYAGVDATRRLVDSWKDDPDKLLKLLDKFETSKGFQRFSKWQRGSRLMRPVRQMAGKFLTNVKEPSGYSVDEIKALIKEKGWDNVMQAVREDKPLFSTAGSLRNDPRGWFAVRDRLYRDYFDLPNRVVDGDEENPIFKKITDKTWEFNPDTPEGKDLMQLTHDIIAGRRDRPSSHTVLGGFAVHKDDQGRYVADPWDFHTQVSDKDREEQARLSTMKGPAVDERLLHRLRNITDKAIGNPVTVFQRLDKEQAEEKIEMAVEVLPQLLKAKEHSDKRQFDAKAVILQKLIRKSPGDFVVDSRDGDIVGITHTPTKFRIHMPVKHLPGNFKAAAEEKIEKGIAKGQKIETDPSDAQKESENYKKGHANLGGLDISVENPVGSYRSGTDDDGNEWKQKIYYDYGYIKKSRGFDKDHLDVFVSDAWTEDKPVFVVNQVWKGKFDEHKCMLGFDTEAEARKAYLKNYEDGWKGCGSIVEMTFEKFKTWTMGDGPSKGSLRQTEDMKLRETDKTASVLTRCLQNAVKEANYTDKTIHEGIEGMQNKFAADDNGGIDPAWFTTPAGAMAGAFLVHALSKNPSWKKDLGGAAVGGALGYGAARLPNAIEERTPAPSESSTPTESTPIAPARPSTSASVETAPKEMQPRVHNALKQYKSILDRHKFLASDRSPERRLDETSDVVDYNSTPAPLNESQFAKILTDALKADPKMDVEDFTRKFVSEGRSGEAFKGTSRNLRSALRDTTGFESANPFVGYGPGRGGMFGTTDYQEQLRDYDKDWKSRLAAAGQPSVSDQRIGKAVDKWMKLRQIAEPYRESSDAATPGKKALVDYVAKRRADGVSTAKAVQEFVTKNVPAIPPRASQWSSQYGQTKEVNDILDKLMKDPLN